MAKVLVVDDEKSIRISLREFLRDADYEVGVAEDADEAMGMLATEDFDVVVSDIILPRVTGVKLLKAIKKTSPYVQVILMTGEPTVETASEAVRAGAFDYLSKPIGKEQILKTVATAVKLKALDDERRRLAEENRRYQENLELLVEERTVALRESEERMELALRGADLGTWDWNVQTGDVTFNERWAEMLGYTLDEIEPRLSAWEKLVHPDDMPGVQEVLNAHLEGKTSFYETEVRLRHKSGNLVWVLVKGRVIERDADGEPLRACGTHLDITERKRAEEEKKKFEAQLRQQQKMEAIGTLAGGIAHDFNNVLFVIAGYSKMGVRALPEDDKLRGYFQSINAAGNRAGDLVNQILTFTRQSEVKLKALIVNPLIKEAIKFLRATLPTTIEIKQNIQPDCGKIMADPTQIHQVIMNLCTNASYAMREKGGLLTIRLSDFEINKTNLPKPNMKIGNYVQLTVEDTGGGIPNKILERIFDPFFTTKPVGEGTGMGLSVIHGIVEDYGGAITVESKIGEGTKFKIFLPVVKEDIKSLEAEAAVIPKGNESILFVDDEEMLVKLEKEMAESFGYKVTIANSSRKALEIFESNKDKFDLIITDQTMPGMTGVELAKEIWEIHPDIPIIMTTGFSHAVNEDQARDMGFSGFFNKPIKREVLGSTIRKVLDRNN